MSKRKNEFDVLLEIRMENIPARFILSAEKQMRRFLETSLSESRLSFGKINIFGTYKRLVAHIEGVGEKTERKILLVKGPPARFLKDEKGEYTPESTGFAVKQGVRLQDLRVEKTPKGDFIFAEKEVGGESSKAKLGEIFSAMISSLEFPKSMIWEETGFRFARPLRGIVSLFGDKIIPVRVAGVKGGRTTEGLNAKGGKTIIVRRVTDYFRILRNVNVIVKDDERRQMLEREIKSAAARMSLSVNLDEDLLLENLYLVEYPVVVSGDFSIDFLKLPPELINLVMKKHLKFFSLSEKNGSLAPYFIGIKDGVSRGQKNVRTGFKNVLEARFKDAVFFYEKDLAAGIKNYAGKIGEIILPVGLGTLKEKAQRVKKVADFIASLNLFGDLDRSDLNAACQCLFADIPSEVVREFPELEGIMAYYYMKKAGFSEKAASSVREYHFPLSTDSPLPSGEESLVLSLAGKTETLVSFFAAGLSASGTQDPYALRKQASGLARILVEKEISLNLREVFRVVRSTLPDGMDFDCEAEKSLLDFIWQRAEVLFQQRNFKFDELRAEKDFFARDGDLFDASLRVSALSEMRKNPSFADLILLFKRAKNIIKQAKFSDGCEPVADLFEKGEEKNLHLQIAKISSLADRLLSERKYSEYLGEITGIKPVLDTFFDGVMVMVEDERIRTNRLRLVSSLIKVFEKFGDLSMIQQEI